uniref:DUF4216 domain-containing protein n=1 Tax=Tanacetum cinerariifolium TaxID=118510 RepID=A0A6L2LC25_TANCI|nr:hypothetical protein [Tanacetum cinerariifolium]
MLVTVEAPPPCLPAPSQPDHQLKDKHGESLPPLPPPPQPPSPEYDNMAAFLDEIIRPDNESTQTTGPQPTQTTGPQPTQTTGPQPTQTTGPQPTQTTGPQPTQTTGHHIDNEFEALFSRATDKLYPGCTWMTSLEFLAKMSHAKVLGKITDIGFNLILKVLQEAFPHGEGFKIPSDRRRMKKMQNYLICNASRWKDLKTKGKKVANKVVRYFSLIPRLKRLYKSQHTAKWMTWHSTGKSKENGQMNHPVDGKAWKFFDIIHSEFAKDPRNIRLGLAADGFNPFGNLSQTYSMWPVILTTYNTPPWICMKETSFILTMLILGPKSPAKDIDVFLQPLIRELQTLWSGVWTRDVVTCPDFKMKAALLWTINDFPARSSLSGWSGQGYLPHMEFPNNNLEAEFPHWFDLQVRQKSVENDPRCSPESGLFSLSCGPESNANSYVACVVNGVKFLVHDRDIHRTTKRSRVATPRPNGEMFYGQLEEILELTYIGNRKGINHILTDKDSYKDQQYILATHARQVFYLEDPARRPPHWKVVEDVHHRKIWHRDVVEDDQDVIHDSNSSDVALSANLGDLDYTSLSTNDESTKVDASLDNEVPDEESADFIGDEDDVAPHVLEDDDQDEDVRDDDGPASVHVVSSDDLKL